LISSLLFRMPGTPDARRPHRANPTPAVAIAYQCKKKTGLPGAASPVRRGLNEWANQRVYQRAGR